MQNNLSFCNLKVVFRSPYKLHSLFRFKDTLYKKIRSHLIYHCLCTSYNAIYYGKTYQHFFTWAAKHMGVSNFTDKHVKYVKESEIFDHLLQWECATDFDHFDNLASDTNSLRLLIKESLLTKCDKPILNGTVKSLPLKRFD